MENDKEEKPAFSTSLIGCLVAGIVMAAVLAGAVYLLRVRLAE